MEKNRFDDLTRAMAAGASRRDLLKGVLGGVAAGAAVTVMPEVVGAQDETCIEPGGECEMEEGAVACCGSYTCFEAICDNARGCWEAEDICDDQFPCCDETLSCIDGTCVAPDDGDDAVGGQAETLPSTGIGDSPSSSGWLGAVAAGGAVAAAATVLRRNRERPEEGEIS